MVEEPNKTVAEYIAAKIGRQFSVQVDILTILTHALYVDFVPTLGDESLRRVQPLHRERVRLETNRFRHNLEKVQLARPFRARRYLVSSGMLEDQYQRHILKHKRKHPFRKDF